MFTPVQIFLYFVLSGPILSAHPLCPGTEWNCKCDLEQTNDPPTENANIHTPAPPLGLEGNPYHTHQLFTDRVSYIRHNTKLLGAERAERLAQRVVINNVAAAAKNALQGKTATCDINGSTRTVMLTSDGLKHCAQDLFGNKVFWLKNEVLPYIDKLLKTSKYIGKKASETTHNKRKQTVKLKVKTDYFYYVEMELPNGKRMVASIGHFRSDLISQNADKYYLYAINLSK